MLTTDTATAEVVVAAAAAAERFVGAGMRPKVRDELSMTLCTSMDEIEGALSGLEKLKECCKPLPGPLLPVIILLSSSPTAFAGIDSPPADFPSSRWFFFCCAAWAVAAAVAIWLYPCLAASGRG